jgi:hypothetical protein
MRVLSFGTPGRFEGYLALLRQSLDAHGIPHELEVIGQRVRGMAAFEKPQFILDRLTEPVLWLDADSYVLGPIVLPEGEWDVGFQGHWRAGSTVTCCAVAFRPTDKAREFLARWTALCPREGKNISGTEHDRMLTVRAEYPVIEVELSDCLKGKLVVNYRIQKEHYC